MKKHRTYRHKNLNTTIEAIQYVGDKNKYNICEFLKGRKIEVIFANGEQIHMNIAIGADDYFALYEKQWLYKDGEGNIGVISIEAFQEYYEPV